MPGNSNGKAVLITFTNGTEREFSSFAAADKALGFGKSTCWSLLKRNYNGHCPDKGIHCIWELES